MAEYPLQTSNNVFAYSFSTAADIATNNYLIIKNHPSLNLNATPFTIECWVNPQGNYGDFRTVFSKRDMSGAAATSYAGYLGSSSGGVSWRSGATWNSEHRPTSNDWSHVAWSFDNTTLKLFLNGIQVGSGPNTNINRVIDYDQPLLIGGTAGQSHTFEGLISNFRIIKDQAIYSNNFTISTTPVPLPNNDIGPATGSNVAGSLTGNVVLLTCHKEQIVGEGNSNHQIYIMGDINPVKVEAERLQKFSYFFGNTGNSNGSCIVTTNNNFLNLNLTSFTIETWIYPIEPGGVIVNRAGGPNNARPSYSITWNGANLYFAGSSTNTSINLGSSSNANGYIGTPTLNAWNHVAVTLDGNVYRGFLNGNLGFSQSSTLRPYNVVNGRGITVGGNFINGQTWNVGIPTGVVSGYISNLRILRGTALYTDNFTPSYSTAGLTVNDVVLMAGNAPGSFTDLNDAVAVGQAGTSQIRIIPFGPDAVTSNAVINANSTSYTTLSYSSGMKYKITNQTSYADYASPQIYSATVGARIGKILNNSDPIKIALPAITSIESGQRLKKIKSIAVDLTKFAYIPTGGAGGGNSLSEFEFWS
jgi:hypothetical protein